MFYVQYWPVYGSTMNVGPFIISNVGEMTSAEVRITDLQLILSRNSTTVINPTCHHRRSICLLIRQVVQRTTAEHQSIIFVELSSPRPILLTMGDQC